MKYYLLWDVDDTLLDFKMSEKYALESTFAKQGIICTPEMVLRYSEINESCWKRFEKGEITRAQLMVERFETFVKEFSIENADLSLVMEAYPEALGEAYFYLEDSPELLKELKKQGHRNYIITNGASRVQEKKLKKSGIQDLAEGIFISENIGFHKPAKEFFDYCLREIAKENGESMETVRKKCLVIGDSLSSDIAGALNSGLAACHYVPRAMGQKETKVTEDGQVYSQIYHLRDVWELLGGGDLGEELYKQNFPV